jgi:predicted nucleic acid-binding protein
MYLIDTSVLIPYLQNTKNDGVTYFEKILDHDIPYGITGIIYQEVLQGIRYNKIFEDTAAQLQSLKFYHPHPIQTYYSAAHIYRNCRKKGITIRSSIDCIVAQIAIENNLILIHADKDYIGIKKCCPDLRLYEENK